MIRTAAAPWVKTGRTLCLLISAPDGERTARETWNPRLGVEGGISLIGTSGVVEPKSTRAFKASIALCVRQAALLGRKSIIVTLGHVGESFLEKRGIGPEARVVAGDHVGFALERCAAGGMSRILLAGHVGKLAKVAAGLFDTHWSSGDARLETLAACAAACGARRDTVRHILSLSTAEAAESIIRGEGLEETYDFLAARAADRMKDSAGRGKKIDAETGCAVLSLDGTLLGAHPENLKGEESWQSFR
jgi:cobalt-precorrin-5B (C1)-methyltransferase